MKKLIYLFTILVLTACSSDSEDVTKLIKVSGALSITDLNNWIDGENLYVGLFKGDATSPVYYTQISNPGNTAEHNFTISNAESGNYTCKVYVKAERGNIKAVLHTYSQSSFIDDVNLPTTDIQLLSFIRVQEQVFNGCIQCHGGSVGTEADLYLTPDKSYAALVNVKSNVAGYENETLVIPSDAAKSFISKVLDNDVSFNHDYSTTLPDTDKKLIEKWINEGAKDD